MRRCARSGRLIGRSPASVISLTTNGVLLPRFVELKSAGLNRVNISLDSLDPERYRLLTRAARCRRLSG